MLLFLFQQKIQSFPFLPPSFSSMAQRRLPHFSGCLAPFAQEDADAAEKRDPGATFPLDNGSFFRYDEFKQE